MASHPNRSKKNPSASRNPSPAEVVKARETVQQRLKIGITEAQELCANAVHCNLRSWQKWETEAEVSDSSRRMHPAFWELFNIKQGRIKREGQP